MRVTNEPREESAIGRASWTALFFGDATKPLYGLYGPPSGALDREEGVLLCAPPAHEGQRSHWCFRLLGEQLMLAGFHVFRFDYSCHGDSWGSFEQATVAQWVTDVHGAAEELADSAGIRKISAVGLRLGAAMAYLAAQDLPLHHLVLWEPVVDGRLYVEQLRRMKTQLGQPASGVAGEDLLGYLHSADLIFQLKHLSLGDAAGPQASRISLLVAEEAAAFGPWRKHLEKAGRDIEVRHTAEPAGWDEAAAYVEPVLLPQDRRVVVDLLAGALS